MKVALHPFPPPPLTGRWRIVRAMDKPTLPRDRLFAAPEQGDARDFVFDAQVARVFADMINRSVPGYATIIAMSGLMAERFATPGSRLYDLGSSLGATTLALRHAVEGRGCGLVAVDNSAAMVAQCRENIAADPGTTPVTLRCEDIRQTPIEGASLVVLNFTLQFLEPEDRLALLARIHAGLRPGGVLILSEKVHFADPEVDALFIDLHHAYKRANGYSELEIARKRSALERVLRPDTLEGHQRRLSEAGFTSSRVWYQCFNFASIIARRGEA